MRKTLSGGFWTVSGMLSGKRKRGVVLAHQTVRHSLWEQDSLEAYNELLFGNLDGEVEALQQRRPSSQKRCL